MQASCLLSARTDHPELHPAIKTFICYRAVSACPRVAFPVFCCVWMLTAVCECWLLHSVIQELWSSWDPDGFRRAYKLIYSCSRQGSFLSFWASSPTNPYLLKPPSEYKATLLEQFAMFTENLEMYFQYSKHLVTTAKHLGVSRENIWPLTTGFTYSNCREYTYITGKIETAMHLPSPHQKNSKYWVFHNWTI